MLQETHAWHSGDIVRLRGEVWKVEGGQPFPDCEVMRLVGRGRINGGRAVSLLWPFDRPEPIAADRRVRRVRLRRWLHALRRIVATSTPVGRLRTAATAHIDLKAWQLEPALAVLNGLATRVLLADGVGLGKTIQAALVVSELLALFPAARVLVLTPAGLRDQWEEELRGRFGVVATVVDTATLRRSVTQLAAGTNPWSTWPVIVASLDFVKRADVLRGLAAFTWDLLVVDEAHGCAAAPERSACVRVLAGHSRRVVLVTATPHAGDDRAFASLCGLGRLHASESPIVMFRRSRSDVGMESGRRVHLLRVRCTPEEREMHRLLDRYTKEVWQTPASADARLAMLVLRKRALSSAASLVRSLERRAAVLFDVTPAASQLALPFADSALPDEETTEDAEPMGPLAAPGLDDARRERAMLVRLIAAAKRAAAGESKASRLCCLLRRARQPAIVFTEYRDTARSLTLALQPIGNVVTLHGALGRYERKDIERQFTEGSATVLVATDAAGEGLNLHRRCRLVVNLELPWNPLRLEQRIGRVDRLGQTRRPHAVHLVAASTAEERVVERLVVRQERARHSLGALADVVGQRAAVVSPLASVTEATVMQRVMEGASTQAPMRRGTAESSWATPTHRTVEVKGSAPEECCRLQEVRRTCGYSLETATTTFGGTLVTTLPRRRAHAIRTRCPALGPGIVAVFVVRVMNADHSLIEQWPCCVHVSNAAPGDLAQLAPTLREHVAAIGNRRLMAVADSCERVFAAGATRERLLASTVSAPRAPLQPGMFDRRAIKAAEQAAEERAAQKRDREAGAIAFTSAPLPQLATPELSLVLVLPV